MNLENLDLEKYEQLELERANTMNDLNFQSWAKDLNVSQSYEDRNGIIKANELNRQYDYSSLMINKSKSDNILNTFVSLFQTSAF
jgi:hypothetical protein